MARGYTGASFFATDSNWEVQRTNHFELVITGLSRPAEIIRMAAESVKIPSINVETTELRHGNEIVKVATNPSFDGGSLVMKDAIGADLEMAIWEWFTRVLDIENDSVMGLVVNYKMTTRLIQYSPNNSVARTWKCLGVFPTSFDAGDLTYAQPDKKLITANMSVDKCIPER
jgi:hypothetical protein